MRFIRAIKASLLVVLMLTLSACGAQSQFATRKMVDYENIQWKISHKNAYATMFLIEEAEDYTLITVNGDTKYLLVKDKEAIPNHLPKDVTVILHNPDKSYVVASSVFDFLREIKSLDSICLSGVKEENQCIEEVLSKMQEGQILYAGKYSAPDYELILGQECNLAIENTMIYHSPQVIEELKKLQIPVFVDYSSYESHPLGRLEWICVYGALYGKSKEAEEFFEAERARIEPIMEKENTGMSVAFFHVNSNGTITVRKPGDYIAKMISLSGGNYALDGILAQEENALSTMNIQMEDFYLAAKDADILIYNSTIVGELNGMQDLLAINPIFADFKAVKEKKVYCTGKDFFQETTGTCAFMEDLNHLFGGQENDFTYLIPLS